jgi:GNAT superfamily N-acetyltransferase
MTNLEDLTYRWQLGWRASRDLPAPEAIDGGLRIHCAQPGRKFEVLALRADEDPASVSRVAAQVLAAKERTWLTAVTSNPERTTSAIEAAGLKLLYRPEWFMNIDLASQPHQPLDPAYTSEVRTEGPAIKVTIHDATGEVAARGQVGLAGDDAVADRIETMPNHRRRGLGSAVMSALATEAIARGARTGLLIASADGQHLYSTLGWNRVADVVIAQAPGRA